MRYFMDAELKIKDIRSGEFHSLAIDLNGALYACGRTVRLVSWVLVQAVMEIKSYLDGLWTWRARTLWKSLVDAGHSYAKTEQGEHFLWGHQLVQGMSC